MHSIKSSSPANVRREHVKQHLIERHAVDGDLSVPYSLHEHVAQMIDIIVYCLENISLEFDRWGEAYVKGPGFYIVIVSGDSVDEYADPMGDNRWDTERCESVFDDVDEFHRTVLTTATECDGAVIVSVDGVILPQMVRLRDRRFSEREEKRIEYADWMGSRHMSAVDTSTRENVVATITLSEENGRVTICVNGEYEDYSRAELGGRWRADDE